MSERGEPDSDDDPSLFSYDDKPLGESRTVRCSQLDSFSRAVHAAVAPGPPRDRLDRYEDAGEIGRGGMGSVRRVVDRIILREAALKELDETLGESPDSVKRFLEEAQITGQLDHPNIVPVYDLGVSDNGAPAFFTMKLVEGRTLREVLKEGADRPLTGRRLEELLQTFVKVCDALSFAHSRGVIHRDLKPDNVMVGTHGQVYVMDWGIAKLMEEGEPSSIRVSRPPEEAPAEGIIGTPAYMAPEQAWGFADQVDQRTDVFGLGGILYKMLTGNAPLQAASHLQTLHRARTAEIVPPEQTERGDSLPHGLCRIAMKALAAKPTDRFQTVLELKHSVEEFLRGGGWFATRVYQAGDVIVREGDAADAAYIINSGRCQVSKRTNEGESKLRVLGPGEAFGETAVVTDRPRTASVTAMDEVEVTVVTRDSLENELSRSSWLRSFVRALAERFHELEEQVPLSHRRAGSD